MASDTHSEVEAYLQGVDSCSELTLNLTLGGIWLTSLGSSLSPRSILSKYNVEK